MKFSIVIVTYNKKKYLERCLNSIKRSTTSKLSFEVIVIFNGETSYFSSISKNYPDYKCFYIPSQATSVARNYGVNKCIGENIFFLDEDCYLPEGYFEKIDFNLKWDVLGGPDATPQNASDFEKSLGYALSSPFCTGWTYKRHTSHIEDINVSASESSLILCNLWFKRELFQDKAYSFPSDLFHNEEKYLLKKLKDDSKILLYNAKTYVYHSRKSDLRSLATSVIKSGEHRVKSFSKSPKKEELLYLLPLVFTAFITYAFIHPFSFIALGLMIYTFSATIYMFSRKKFTPTALFFHYIILIFYSLGLLKGLKNSAQDLRFSEALKAK